MNCEKFGEQLGLYWDLPEGDPVKKQLSEHIRTCNDCREQFRLLDESRELVKQAAPEQAPTEQAKVQFEQMNTRFSEHVMKRIYEDESWRMPVADRMYSFSFKVRRNLTMLIAFFLALFMISFLHFAFVGTDKDVPADIETAADPEEFSGLMQVASASGSSSNVNTTLYESSQGMRVASIQDPLIFMIGTDPTSPNYLLIFSILGMAVTILIMNWFSRIRS